MRDQRIERRRHNAHGPDGVGGSPAFKRQNRSDRDPGVTGARHREHSIGLLASRHHGNIARKESRQPQVFAKRSDYVACGQRIDTVRGG